MSSLFDFHIFQYHVQQSFMIPDTCDVGANEAVCGVSRYTTRDGSAGMFVRWRHESQSSDMCDMCE